MATLPRANVEIQDTATAIAAGTDTVCIWAPVPTNADTTPRLFGSAAAVYAQHGYSEGVEYAALHADKTRKPFVFVGLPIATAGAVGRVCAFDSVIVSVTAGVSGVLAEHDGVLVAENAGTVGTDSIVLKLSLDGGETYQRVRLGSGLSLVVPFVGVTVTFTAGAIVAGDTLVTWHGSSPRSNAAGWLAARTALAALQYFFRSIVLVGDLADSTEAAAYLAQLDAYESANERDVYGRASVYDRLPLASLEAPTYHMTGSPTVTFAEVGGSGDTITRSAGSFIADGFQAGDLINVTGSVSNNITAAAVLANAAALVLTLGTDDLVAEGPKSGVTIVGHEALVFANAGDTITRSRGSWIDDGFRDGDAITIAGTSGGTNDGAKTASTVTDSVLILSAGGVAADEVIRADAVTIGTGQAKAVWMAEITAEFGAIDDAHRIDMSAGRRRALSPFSAWYRRTPLAWLASCREFQHDLHVPTWRKNDGPVSNDTNVDEWDDRVDGEAGCAARFTVARSYANGPQGAFIAQSLTRAKDASFLVMTHNVAVVDLACQVTRSATENIIGRVLVLDTAGKATRAALNTIATEVNAALSRALLADTQGEGPRVSQVKWTPSSDDILNVSDAKLTGVLLINLNGTIHSVDTVVRVSSGGQ
jgi:hypothetical protein